MGVGEGSVTSQERVDGGREVKLKRLTSSKTFRTLHDGMPCPVNRTALCRDSESTRAWRRFGHSIDGVS